MNRLDEIRKAFAQRVGANRRLFSVPLEAAAPDPAADSGASGGGDRWHTVAITGEFDHWMGPFRVETDDLDKMVAAFDGRKTDPPIDFNHSTVFGGGEGRAAGWPTAMRRLDDRLQVQIDWTPAGKKALEDREYKYFSPTLTFKDTENETGIAHNAGPIHSIALTNHPFLQELPEAALCALSGIGATPPKPKPEEMEMPLKGIAKVLGLPEGAPAEEITAACADLAGQRIALGQIAQSVGLQADASPSEIMGTAKALAQSAARATELETRANEAEAKIAKIDADTRFAKALEAGKITPELKEWARALAASDPAQFDAWAAAAPKAIPVDPKAPAKSGEIDSDTKALAAKWGMTPEEFARFDEMQSYRPNYDAARKRAPLIALDRREEATK